MLEKSENNIETNSETIADNEEITANQENVDNADRKNSGNYKVLAAIVAVFLGMAAGAAGVYFKYKSSIEFGEKYPLVIETYDFMKDVELGVAKDVEDGVQINSYLSLYDDKYTFYEKSDPDSSDWVVEYINTAPTAYGCGFDVAFDDNDRLYFASVNEDMQAYKQGIREGDIVVSVDELTIETYNDARKILGKDGTVSELVLDRNGEEVRIKFTRYNDNDASAHLSYEMFGDIFYVKFDSMNYMHQGRIYEALTENTYDSLIIDLRDNGGGHTQVAAYLADPFVDKITAYMNSYDGTVETYSTVDGVDVDVPIVLLVSEKTASAAEIFTSFLKQGADTTIVGTNTFGKGIFQNEGIFKGGALRYTSGYFTVGNWECWQGVGIEPDVKVEMDSSLIGTDEDIQLQKALELLS